MWPRQCLAVSTRGCTLTFASLARLVARRTCTSPRCLSSLQAPLPKKSSTDDNPKTTWRQTQLKHSTLADLLLAPELERDNRSRNRRMARESDPDGSRRVCPELEKCRSTKEFVRYARKKGATVVFTKNNHVKVFRNGASSLFAGFGRPHALRKSIVKEKIEDFKAMGIAWKE